MCILLKLTTNIHVRYINLVHPVTRANLRKFKLLWWINVKTTRVKVPDCISRIIQNLCFPAVDQKFDMDLSKNNGEPSRFSIHSLSSCSILKQLKIVIFHGLTIFFLPYLDGRSRHSPLAAAGTAWMVYIGNSTASSPPRWFGKKISRFCWGFSQEDGIYPAW